MQFSFKYKTHLFHRCRQRHCSNAKYQVPVWPTCCKSRHQPLSSLVSPFLSHVRFDTILTVPFKRDFVSNRTFATLNTIQCLVACLCCSLNPWFTGEGYQPYGPKKASGGKAEWENGVEAKELKVLYETKPVLLSDCQVWQAITER